MNVREILTGHSVYASVFVRHQSTTLAKYNLHEIFTKIRLYKLNACSSVINSMLGS